MSVSRGWRTSREDRVRRAWRSRRRPSAAVECPGCARPVAVADGRIVFHALGRRPDWMEAASELGPVARWCPASDAPAPSDQG